MSLLMRSDDQEPRSLWAASLRASSVRVVAGGNFSISPRYTAFGLIGRLPMSENISAHAYTEIAMHYVKYACGKRYVPVSAEKKAERAETRRQHAISRFWSRVDVSAGPEGCWLWSGGVNHRGYGVTRLAGVRNQTAASRAALIYSTGLNPADQYALHNCDNRLCCNPGHLRWGSALENADDREERVYGRKSGERAEEIASAIQLFDTGCNMAEIARRLEIPHSRIAQMLARHRGKREREKLLASAS